MRAAENQSVDAALLKTFEIRFNCHFDDFIVRPTFFDQRHKEWTGAAVHFDDGIHGFESMSVGATLYRRFSADDANFFILRAVDCPSNSRLDDADHWNGKAFF